jgi:hypothetical protein
MKGKKIVHRTTKKKKPLLIRNLKTRRLPIKNQLRKVSNSQVNT